MAEKVYFWNKIGKEEETPKDAEKTSFTIERAVLITPPNITSTQSNSLYLVLSKDNEKKIEDNKYNSYKVNFYRYGMHDPTSGSEGVIAPFLNKMDIKYSKSDKREVSEEIKELEGRKLIGYFKIDEDSKSFIKGISIEGDNLE